MKIELLAPAKDREHGIAAINHGADAVYIGASRFGARTAATNSTRDIESLCKHAHLYNAKVYVALNTILKDEEIPGALDIARQVHEAGADALIIQDMGLLEAGLPPIPLFASTQTHNADAPKVKFLQDVGFKRVILARELSLSEIQEIRDQTSVELESFVHGAICVCYSGQCYLSQALCGRSGNRGECAQPCRLAYSLVDGSGNIIASNKHLLSVKDLNLSRYIGQMIDAGISSFKIEGRLKDINYVKNVTAFYRNQIDEILLGKKLEKSSSGHCSYPFSPDLDSTFSRGYTSYFINGRQANIASLDTPKSIGKELGIVTRTSSTSLEVQTRQKLSNNDGLCFFTRDNKLEGFKVNKVDGNKIFPFKMPRVHTGATLYRNQDVLFEKALAASENPRTISAHATFSEEASGIRITIADEDTNSVSLLYPCTKTPASNAQTASLSIEKQFKKTGNSTFRITHLDINVNSPLFFPISTLNEMRRQALGLLEDNRMSTYNRSTGTTIVSNAVAYPTRQLDYTANITNSLADQFYKRHGCSTQKGYEIQEPALKTVMRTRYCIRHELGLCLKGKNGQEPGTFTPPLYLEDDRNRYRLVFDCQRCEMRLELMSC